MGKKWKKWTPKEINVLRRLTKKGLTPEEIFQSGKIPNRSFRAIDTQVKRLSHASQEKFHAAQVNAEKVAELKEIIQRYASAFRKICDQTSFSRAEIERFKVIFQAAAKYRDLFLAYAEVKAVDERLAEIEKMVKTLQAQVSTGKTA